MCDLKCQYWVFTLGGSYRVPGAHAKKTKKQKTKKQKQKNKTKTKTNKKIFKQHIQVIHVFEAYFTISWCELKTSKQTNKTNKQK